MKSLITMIEKLGKISVRSSSGFRFGILWGLIIFTLPAYVKSVPEPVFPFNAQVPSVARVSEPYNFTLSEKTFRSDERTIRYTLAQNPTWLKIDPISRRLSGTPRENDDGSFDFSIIATDDTGSWTMQARLAVTSKPLQGFGTEIEKQLEQQASLSGPRSMILRPSQSFELVFSEESTQGSDSTLSYYATMADNSPLPPWIIFNNSALTFYGRAPLLESYPRKYDLLFIKSDIPGYAGATFEFSVLISDHDFRFIPQQRSLTVTHGASFEYTGFQESLFLDGRIATSSELESVTASAFPNLQFDYDAFILKGIASDEPQTFSVLAKDVYGNTAESTLRILHESYDLFGEEAVAAVRGTDFEYKLPEETFGSRRQDLEVQPGKASSWLKFDRDNMLIHGHVPSDISMNKELVTVKVLYARANVSEIYDLKIRIASSASDVSSPSLSVSRSPPLSQDQQEKKASAIQGKEKRQLNKSIIAIAVMVPFLALVMLVIFVIAFRTYRKEARFKKNLIQRNISLPMSQSGEHGNEFEGSYIRDVENSPRKPYSNPPQLPPLVPKRSSKRGTWLEPIENSIQDTVPEGNRSITCTETSRGPFPATSQTWQTTETGGSGSCCNCISDTTGFDVARPVIVYPGDRYPPIYGGPPQTRPCHHIKGSCGKEKRRNSSSSLRTRSMSVLSFTPSVFPAPPLRNKKFVRRSTPIPPKQHSIRIVSRTPSTLTTTDRRSMQEKRQSFIRARVSGRSPFFSAASYKKSSRSAYGQNGQVPASCDWTSFSSSQPRNICTDTSCSLTTKSPSLATAEREIEEFWTNYPSMKKDNVTDRLPRDMANRQGFIEASLEKLEGSSKYTTSSDLVEQANISYGASRCANQNIDVTRPIRPVSTKVVDRPHPLVGRRNNTQRRKIRLKSLLHPSSSNIRKRKSQSALRHSSDETHFELCAKRGLGIVLDLSTYERSKISTEDCEHATSSRSPLSEVFNCSPKPRLVNGKGKRPVSVQGAKPEDKWGSLSGLRGNEAFI